MNDIKIINNISPLRYPGGKTRACKVLDKILIKHFNINNIENIISPFFGGGSFEFFLQKIYFQQQIPSQIEFSYACYLSYITHYRKFLELPRHTALKLPKFLFSFLVKIYFYLFQNHTLRYFDE